VKRGYLVLFPCLIFAHLARCAAAIFLRPAADIVGFATTPFDDVLFAHRAFCARLILLRADADRVRLGFVKELPPFNLRNTARASSTCLS